MEINRIYNEDCLECMKTLSDNSVDSVVTDPPYELGFMGKSWDSTGIAYNVEMWKEVLRVLKPGGHLLAFGGTRTYHRMACAIEDAGFEIRDQMQWIYGSGFPKNMDISKAIDKKLGKTREVIGQYQYPDGKPRVNHEQHKGTSFMSGGKAGKPIEAPASDEAKQWDGWGTALKPANEPIVVARKPLSEKTVAANVLRWGTGGLNIGGCRIGTKVRFNDGAGNKPGGNALMMSKKEMPQDFKGTPCVGRFPANIILDEVAGELLDAQTGTLASGGGENTGCASRFFYCAKAAKKERGEGNVHPTVKPLKLMKYLVKLVTPPKGVVLDPFTGSGTTAIACMNTKRNFIGFEMDKGYYDIACKRIEGHRDKVKDGDENGNQ